MGEILTDAALTSILSSIATGDATFADSARLRRHSDALRARVEGLEKALNRRDALLLDVWDAFHREGWEKGKTINEVMDRLGDWRWNNGYDPCNPPMQPDPRAALAAPADGEGKKGDGNGE